MFSKPIFVVVCAVAVLSAWAAPPDLTHLQHHVLRSYNRVMQAQQLATSPPAPEAPTGAGVPIGGAPPPGSQGGGSGQAPGAGGSGQAPGGGSGQAPGAGGSGQAPGGGSMGGSMAGGSSFGGPSPLGGNDGGFGGGFDAVDAPPMCRRGSHFQIASDRVATVCAGANFTVLEPTTKYSSVDLADREWHTFCTSFCVSTMMSFQQFTEFAPCLNEQVNGFIAPILAMCQRRNGRYCGATLGMRSTTCETPNLIHNESGCKAKSGCSWDGQSCMDSDVNVIFDRMCDPCVQDLMSSFGPDSEMARTLTYSCKKIGGKYCELEVGHLVPRLKNSLDWFTPQNLDEVCAPNATYKYQCLSFFAGKDFTQRMQEAATAYPTCVERHGQATCLQQLRDGQRAVFDDSRRIALMCDSRNRTDGTRDYCLPHVPALLNNECFQRATGTFRDQTTMMGMMTSGNPQATGTGAVPPTTAFFTTTAGVTSTGTAPFGAGTTGAPQQNPAECNAQCDVELAGILDIGCCRSTIDEYFRVVFDFSMNDVPVLTELQPGDLPPALAPPANIRDLARCSRLSNISEQVNLRCVPQPQPSPLLALHFRLNASFLFAAPQVRDRLMDFIIDDLASLLGLRPSDIIDSAFSRNASNVFNGNMTGVSLSFRLQPRRADVLVFSLEEFRRLFSHDQIVLPQAVAFLKKCKECVGRSGAADFIVTQKGPLELPNSVRGDLCMDVNYFDIELELDRVCGNEQALDAMNYHEGWSANQTRSAIAGMCQGACFTTLRKVINSQFAQCLPSDILAIGALLGVACSKDGDAFCGESMHIADQLQCETYANQSTCTSKSYCVWNLKKKACYNNPSAQYLEPLCQECMGRFVAAMAAQKGPIAKLVLSTDALLCSRDGKALCRPMISKELNTVLDEGYSVPLLQDLCGNATKRRCFKRVYAGQASLWRQGAEDTFADCTVKANFEPTKVFSHCLPALFQSLADTQIFEDIVSQMCVVNPVSGIPCLGFVEKYQHSPCVEAVMNKKTCNSTCDAELRGIVNAMGCCAGVVHRIFGREAAIRPDDLPNFGLPSDDDFSAGPGGAFGDDGPFPPTTVVTPAPVPTTLAAITYANGENASNVEEVEPTQGFMRLWAACPSLTDIATSATGIRKVCKKPREAEKIVRDLPIGLAFNKMQGKTGRRMLQAILADLGNKLGLSKDDFPGTNFTEDPNNTVVTPKRSAAAGRGFWVQAAGTNAPTSGAKVSITMSASKSEDGKAAQQQYDDLVASGRLTLPSAVKTTASECQGCTSASGGATSLQSAATITSLATSAPLNGSSPTTAKPASGSSLSISMLVALMASALLAL